MMSAALALTVAGCGARSALTDGGGPADAGPGEPPPDAAPSDCGPGVTDIYLLSMEHNLIRFSPSDLTFTTIGKVDCPLNASAYSMAVNRQGVAYVRYSDGELFRVSTLTAKCEPTGFVAGQGGFPMTFSMAFVADQGDPGETLFLAGMDFGTEGTPVLGTLDTATFTLSTVGKLDQPVGRLELTGTGDGRLVGFAPGAPGSHVFEIDKSSAAVQEDMTVYLDQIKFDAYAFAFWGGKYYIFSSSAPGGTVVHAYTPGEVEPSIVAQIDKATIVGAGVSTCAPLE
jgi:hypothetical protein